MNSKGFGRTHCCNCSGLKLAHIYRSLDRNLPAEIGGQVDCCEAIEINPFHAPSLASMRASNAASTWRQSAARPLSNWATRRSTSAIRSRSSFISLARRAASCRIDALHVERVDDGGGVYERLLPHVTPNDELVGQVLTETGDVGDFALVDVGRRVDAPGAQNGAACWADVGELGSLDAEGCQVARSLLGLGLEHGAGTDARLALGGKCLEILLQRLDRGPQIGDVRWARLGKPGCSRLAPGGIGGTPSARALQERNRGGKPRPPSPDAGSRGWTPVSPCLYERQAR